MTKARMILRGAPPKTALGVVGLLLLSFGVLASRTARAAGIVRKIPSAGTVTLRTLTVGNEAIQFPELDPGLQMLGEPDLPDLPDVNGGQPRARAGSSGPTRLHIAPSSSDWGGRFINRSFARRRGFGGSVKNHERMKNRPNLALSFDGLNFRDQRLANGGNQFSIEPPDQGLCVGNGFVLEAVNTVMRVYHTDGTTASGVEDLNTFYGYPAQLNRTTGEQGPFITDPVC